LSSPENLTIRMLHVQRKKRRSEGAAQKVLVIR
jgi:hypothetical protein